MAHVYVLDCYTYITSVLFTTRIGSICTSARLTVHSVNLYLQLKSVELSQQGSYIV